MIICEVEQTNGVFVFTAPCKIEKGIYVMCNTMYGEAPGRVKRCIEVKDTKDELFRAYLDATGAYEPLKEITGIFIPLKWLTPSAKESKVYEDQVRR